MSSGAVKRASLFASDCGGKQAAALYSLIETAKLDGIDPGAYLRDVLTRIADRPKNRLTELLPWNWQPPQASPQRRPFAGRLPQT